VGQRYLQLDIETTRPEVVVSRLYQKALQCMRAARSTEGSDRLARTRSLRRSLDIVAELRSSLDLEVGGEVAGNLDRLYDFVSDRLMLAGVEPDDAPIEEALSVLEPLADAWGTLASGAVACGSAQETG